MANRFPPQLFSDKFLSFHCQIAVVLQTLRRTTTAAARTPRSAPLPGSGPIHGRALDVLYEPVSRGGMRTVVKRGIQVGRRWYVAAELGAHVGERVRCYRDFDDDARICVYGDDTWICWAVDAEGAVKRQCQKIESGPVGNGTWWDLVGLGGTRFRLFSQDFVCANSATRACSCPLKGVNNAAARLQFEGKSRQTCQPFCQCAKFVCTF